MACASPRLPTMPDPALAPFLDLMARDLQQHPERLSAVPAEFAGRLLQLVADAQVDLDAALDPAGDFVMTGTPGGSRG